MTNAITQKKLSVWAILGNGGDILTDRYRMAAPKVGAFVAAPKSTLTARIALSPVEWKAAFQWVATDFSGPLRPVGKPI